MKQLLISGLVIVSSFYVWAADLESMKRELQDAPGWPDMVTPEELKSKGDKLITTLVKCQNLSPDQVRQLIAFLLQNANPDQRMSAWTKVYVLNRLYCNVPEWVQTDDIKFFGGWGGIPVKDQRIRLLYPLVRDSVDSFHIGNLIGSYTGPDYFGLEEFDYLLKRFGVRTSSKGASKGS